jgi:putative peptidoglycan lipid II flippase
MVVTIAGIVIDRYLASLLEDGSMTIMSYATRLIQFPLGLVGVAISSAVLPTLSGFASAELDEGEPRLRDYRATLIAGIRLAFFLMVPALVAVMVLREPLVQLVFQRGQFTAADTTRTSLVLLAYAPQLPFTAMDQLLIVAFYSRKNTRTPVIVGMLTVVLYLITALVLLQPLGVVGLALANAVQNGAHGLILLALIQRTVGHIITADGVAFLARIILAAGGMAALQIAGLANAFVTGASPLVTLVILGGVGVCGYVVLAALLGVSEPRALVRVLRRGDGAAGC